MSDSSKQLTVLVKKTDGTFVRMTLAELESLKNQNAKIKDQKSGSAAKSVKEWRQVARKGWSKDDVKSLLEETVAPFHPALPATSPDRSSQVDDVLEQLGFSVPPQFSNRLRSVIQLFLKDVRTEEQTHETLSRSIKEGGLGLSEAQAAKVVAECEKITNKFQLPNLKPQKENVLPATAVEELPEVYREPPVPAVAAPFNTFAHGTFKLNTQPPFKPIMNDIAAPPLEMGPVDEVKFMNLIEFRRLSSDPLEAASRLKQKFVTLKDESYLLYLQAIEAWYASPLHNDCMSGIIEGLKARKRADEVLKDKNKLQQAELKAITRMEEEL